MDTTFFLSANELLLGLSQKLDILFVYAYEFSSSGVGIVGNLKAKKKEILTKTSLTKNVKPEYIIFSRKEKKLQLKKKWASTRTHISLRKIYRQQIST